MARHGYVYLRDALSWLGERGGRDLGTELGGVLDAGTHRVFCVEKISGGGYTDYIFQDQGGSQHRQRVWKGGWKLGAEYEIQLERKAGGVWIKVDQGGMYHLVEGDRNLVSSGRISELYEYKDRHGLKLSYLNIIGSKEIT